MPFSVLWLSLWEHQRLWSAVSLVSVRFLQLWLQIYLFLSLAVLCLSVWDVLVAVWLSTSSAGAMNILIKQFRMWKVLLSWIEVS